MAIDNRCIANRQDVGMIQFWRQPRLAPEVGEEILIHRARMGHLQRDSCAVDGIERLVDSGHRTVRNASLDSILTESLSYS